MDLNIRNVDPEMVKRLKVEAAELGRTLRDHCISRLQFPLGRGKIDEGFLLPKPQTPKVDDVIFVAREAAVNRSKTSEHHPSCKCLSCKPVKA